MKLVRDRIPEIMKAAGKTPKTHTAEDNEFHARLKDKLLEEVNEFLNDESEEELADILEVLKAICKSKDISFKKIESLQAAKHAERGGFDRKIILD